jgi:hypothetical protein
VAAIVARRQESFNTGGAWPSPKGSGVPSTPGAFDDALSDNGRTMDLDSPFDLSLARRAALGPLTVQRPTLSPHARPL